MAIVNVQVVNSLINDLEKDHGKCCPFEQASSMQFN